MPTLMSRGAAAVVAAGLTAGAMAVLAGPAAAAPAGLSFFPAKGLASTPMYLVAPAPCPAGSTNVVARAFGHGFPAAGQPVITNSTAGVSRTAPFALPLQDTFTGFAADNGTTLSGPYQITLRCINRLGNKTFASYSATVTFSDKAHFTAPAPSSALVAEIEASQQPAQPVPTAGKNVQGNGSANGHSTQPQSSAGASGKGSVGGAGTGNSVGGVAPAAQSSSRSKSGFPWQPTLIVIAFVLIGLGILLRIREVRRGKRRQPPVKTLPKPAVAGSAGPPRKSPTLTGTASANNHVKGNHS